MTPEPMPYNRDISGLEIDPSLFVFAEDENINPDTYKAAMKNTYIRKVPLATALMKQFHVSCGNEDQERIKRMIVSMGWLDHLLDEASNRNASLAVYRDLIASLVLPKFPSELPGWVRPELRDSITLSCHALTALPSEYSQVIAEKALRIGEISGEKAVCDELKEYTAILTEEGSLSSDLVIECLSVSARVSDGYTKLHAWNQQAMIAATLLDAAIDLKEDHLETLTRVRPTVWNRLYLFGRAFTYIPVVVKGLGFRGIKTVVKVGVN